MSLLCVLIGHKMRQFRYSRVSNDVLYKCNRCDHTAIGFDWDKYGKENRKEKT